MELPSKIIPLGRRLKLIREKIAKDKDKGNDCKFDMDDISEMDDALKMARVEGYDDSSYIVSSLKDIKSKLSNNELKIAGSKIDKVLGDIMPFDYQQFFELFKATTDTAERLSGKVCWVLLGPTGAGKSTSIHFLCGSKFKSSDQGNVVVSNVNKSLSNKAIHVGESLTESKTRYIAEVELDLKTLGIEGGRKDPDKVLCVDSPGFEDTAGPEVNMANGIGTVRALKQAKMVKVIITFKEAHLDYRFKIIRSIANNMGKAMRGLVRELDKSNGCISGFLTKSTHGVEAAKAAFKKAYEEQDQQGSTDNDAQIFKALIYKLGNKGPLNEIKIDLQNDENNLAQRKKIAHSLVKNTGYITSPKNAFNEFISDSTLAKLKQQIERDYAVIENILSDNNNYFGNPDCIQYIVDILDNIDELKDIIKTAGGQFVESRLRDCLDLFKSKWNGKMVRASAILSKMELKDCSIRSMAKKLNEFAKIEDMMTKNVKKIEKTKYYKTELNSINCLNKSLHECFDELYKGVSAYLNKMIETVTSDDDGCETDAEFENNANNQQQKVKIIDADDDDDDDDNYNVGTGYDYGTKYDDSDYDKQILLSIQKCSLLKKHKNDKHINKKWKSFEKLINRIMKQLQRKCNNIMANRQALNESNVPKFIFIYSSLCKLQRICITKDTPLKSKFIPGPETISEQYSESKDDYNSEKSQVINIISDSMDKLKINVQKNIRSICTSYSLYKMNVPSIFDTNDDIKNNDIADIKDILNTKAIKTDEEMVKRENKLNSFCSWITRLNDGLKSNNDLSEMTIMNSLQNWLKAVEDRFIGEWLSNGCAQELKKCNQLLIDKQAESWNDVEKLLNECKSLRKIEQIEQNTSQEFYKTLQEFEYSKQLLAQQAAELVDIMNNNDESNINWDKILRIASQLHSAGCSNSSSEIRSINNKISLHLKILKSRTDSFALSIETIDELIKVQNTMHELHTIKKFADFMPDLQQDANECYKILNDQVLDILKEINVKYDLKNCSTESSRQLKSQLESYLDLKKTGIDDIEIIQIIMKCSLPSLSQLINKNDKEIKKLNERNESIDQMIKDKGGEIIKEIERHKGIHEKGTMYIDNDLMDKFKKYLGQNGFQTLKQVNQKLEELKEKSQNICPQERQEARNNSDKIDNLNKINEEIKKCVEIENELKLLNVDTNLIIEYRSNNVFLENKISELAELLKGGHTYLFTQTLVLPNAYYTLQFLQKCREIKWNVIQKSEEKKNDDDDEKITISNKYVAEINQNVSKYLRAYGEYLENNLNNLLRELSITDISNCKLSDSKFRNSVLDSVSKLTDCLSEFRNISSFDHQTKMQQMDIVDKPTQKPLKLVSHLFNNYEITANIDNYINSTLDNHKQDILITFSQNKDQTQKLVILHYVALSMSQLDRYISLKQDHQETYYRIASKIDAELNKFGDDNTKQILPLFEARNWVQLKEILEKLQKTAGVSTGGVAQKKYDEGVMKLFCALNTLMKETKSKLLSDINKDTDVKEENISSLNDNLKAVTNLVETISPHLKNQAERSKVKKEAASLGLLLVNRLKQLMRAALQSVRKRDFEGCEKRLDNISKLMEFNYESYIPVTNANNVTDDDVKNAETAGTSNEVTEELTAELTSYEETTGNEEEKGYSNTIVDEYKKINKEIQAELKKIRDSVDKANKNLIASRFNPYNKLRLKSLQFQLARSQNESFRNLWVNIYDDIFDTISDILHKIKERNNQIQMENECNVQTRDDSIQLMSYQKQTQYFQNIELSLSSFPDDLRDTVKVLLTETKEKAQGNDKYLKEGYKDSVLAGNWNNVANSLKHFQQTNPTMFKSSRQTLITKIADIHSKFNENNKKQWQENLNNLQSYKDIGISFTEIKYYGDDDDDYSNNNFKIPNVQNTMRQMYKNMETQFLHQCDDVKSSLRGHKPYKLLKDAFAIIIKMVQSKEKFPIKLAQRMIDECNNLMKPLERLVIQLKTKKSSGLDANSFDIESLLTLLDDTKELMDADFDSNVRKFVQLIDDKKDSNAESIIEIIDNIKYDDIVKETKDMLNACKDSVTRQGLNKKMVQENQAKRLIFLNSLASKLKTLTKAASTDMCTKHLKTDSNDFKKKYVYPCTKKLSADIKQMQNETKDTFNKQRMNTKELDGANANLESFHAIQDVFAKEIDDESFFDEIKVEEAIVECKEIAINKAQKLVAQIQNINSDTDDNKYSSDQYMQQCAENLIQLEYLNKHINYRTTVNQNQSDIAFNADSNELNEMFQSSIKQSMSFLSTNKKTKGKMNSLYNHLITVDPTYGNVFTQQQPEFKASLAKAMNQKFRALDVTALTKNLQQSEKIIREKYGNLKPIDYGKMEDVCDRIIKRYDELVMEQLRGNNAAKSFEELRQRRIPEMANDVKAIADEAVSTKKDLLEKAFTTISSAVDSAVKYGKRMFTWISGGNSKGADEKDNRDDQTNNPRKLYYTDEMIDAAAEIIPYILAIWSLCSAECYFECTDSGVIMKARNAQIVAICCLLCLDIDCKNEIINNLVEVGTGEGKSVIMAITAITLALLDFDVYCACYSELLSNRDQAAFDDLFVLLGVQKNIRYKTFNKIFEQVINDGGDVRETTKNIVLATDLDDSDSKIDEKEEQKRLLAKKRKILFIDEVDKFFSTDFFGRQYTPSCTIPSLEMKNLVKFVWKKFVDNDSKPMSITVEIIEESDEYSALLKAFNEEWHDLLKESIKDMIDGIRTFKEDNYKIENGRDICYKFSDTFSSKIFYGYRTIFAYLYELSEGNITDELHVDEKLTWFLKCGSFSYAEIPKDFYSIMGVTGSLNSLSQKEHEVIQTSYGINKYVMMPSLFDKSGKLDYAKNKDINILKPEHFYNQLHSTLQEYQINDIDEIQRPILVFFKDENELNKFYDADVCETWRINDVIQKLTPALSEKEKQSRILNATKPNMVTFATEEYGRGIDFKVFDKKLDKKGMHVELTYWTETLAEEIQIKGRTARQGQKGSFHITLNMDEIIDQCKVTSGDIKKHQDDADLYEWINKIRNKVFAQQYDEVRKYVEQIKPIHEDSQELADSLRKNDVKVAKEKLLLFNKGANIQSAAKLSILIDATASMGSCLTQSKIVIQQTIPELVKFLKENKMSSDTFEIQVIAYRNYNATAEEILESCQFTSNQNDLTNFIHSVKPKHGWGPEAVEVAFKQLNHQKKKPNIVILMADAPAQSKEAIVGKRKQKEYSGGETYWAEARDAFFTHLDWKEELDIFMKENKDTSVYCFYLPNPKEGNNYAKENFNEIAKIGNGKSMYLDVNNQKQSVATLQGALSELLLFKIVGNMDLVNKFRQGSKNIPTFL